MTRIMKRKLGKSGIEVCALGLGCAPIGGEWTHCGETRHNGKVNDKESIRAIQRALDLGINFFDTAPNYGAGHSERLLGDTITDRRDEVVIATKFGYEVDEVNKIVNYYNGDMDSDKVVSYLRKDCEASLQRLNTDYIDLYQFHLIGYPVEKAFVVRDALEDLVSEGLIRFYGWSTDYPERARVFAQGRHCAGIQHTLHVLEDFPKMLAVCDEFNQASINKEVLARGVLTGKYTVDSKFDEKDWRSSAMYEDWVKTNLRRLPEVQDFLTVDGRSIVQGALAWAWARHERTIPIPGFRSVAHVEENARAMEFGPLNNEQMHQIDEILGR